MISRVISYSKCLGNNITIMSIDYSEGRHMWVKFESDRENEGRGFLANYTFIKLRKSKLSNEYL